MTTPSELDAIAAPSRWARVVTWFRVALGVAGLVALVAIVRHLGTDVILATLRPAIAWLPILCVIELGRIACEAVATYAAFGSRAKLIPRAMIFRASLIGQAIGTLAPAPRVVTETIKATLLAPFAGAPAATSVGFINQAATLLSVGLFSIPCGVAVLFLEGASPWFVAILVHAVVLTASGLALQAVTRADGPGRWLVRRFPGFSARAQAFRDHASETGLWAIGPTSALLANRAFQLLQYAVAARAIGIDAGLLRALAAEGVNLVASAVGVLVPGGLGTTDGAFTLAADILGTTAARATSLALLIRCMQLVWLLIGSVVVFVAPSTRGADRM